MGKGFSAAATLLGLGLGSLGVATSAAQVPANADLAIVSNMANVRHAKVGEEETFTILATNNGPDAVQLDVRTDQTLDSLEIVSVICDRGVSSDGPFCEYIRPLQPSETVTTTIIAKVQATGSKLASDTACVLSFEGPLNDPNPGNDCATATLRIVGKRS